MLSASHETLRTRRLPGFALLLVALASLIGPAYAQNENEAVGFQSHHAFQDGVYGESIDVLNGAVNVVTPIGPRYQLNKDLGYQLQSFYGSKIWDTSVSAAQTGLVRRGALGLGNALHFGRIYRDVAYVDQQVLVAGNIVTESQYECTWFYVSPDGNEHVLPGSNGPDQGSLTCAGDGPVSGEYTIDSTFYRFTQASGTLLKDWDGTGVAPTLWIETPDGIRYIFDHFVPVYGGSAPNLVAYNAGKAASGSDPKVRRYNRDYGGWYVSRIEDTRAQSTVWVNITYDTGFGLEHLMSGIADSAGRHLDFTNECAFDAGTSTLCKEDSFASNPPNRPAARVKSVLLPSFSGTSAGTTHRAEYDFNYDWRSITNIADNTMTEAANVLLGITYPAYTRHNGEIQSYTLTFFYDNGFGELTGRTLPTGGQISYGYNDYDYLSLGLFGSGFNPNARSRELQTKSVCLTGSTCSTWSYARQATLATNPRIVSVTDPFGNDTLYYYHASIQDSAGYLHKCAEDGWAPEWNDALSYRTEYYEGSGATRTLVRMQTQEHDADTGQICQLGQRSRQNIRVTKATTTYIDDGGKQSSVSNSDWDTRGHWRSVTEIGGDVSGTRTTRTEFYDHDPDRFVYREVTDGKRVLSRTDNTLWNGDPVVSINRLSLPATPGTPATSATAPGDVVTVLAYDANANLTSKVLGDGQVTGSGSVWHVSNQRYGMEYQWQGGYLLSKTYYVNPSTIQKFPWKAIDRDRDGNTGLIFATRDTAGIETGYLYDSLGRLTDITPVSPEYPTQIDYVSIRKTSVRQGDTTVMGGNYTCDPTAGDFLASCYDYDELGRLVKTQKRPYDPSLGNPYQTIDYDIAGRVTFRSEWLWPGQAPCTTSPSSPSCGTTFDFHDPANPSQFDPLGRERKVTTADGKIVQTDYFGQNTRVTVNGIQGTGGLFNATTTYIRDIWGRLVQVQMPNGGGTNADYIYDLRDNLVEADLTDKGTGKRQSRLFQYDALNRLYSSWNPESGTTDFVGYDSLGNLTEQVDAAGTHLTSVYDGAGRLSRLEKREDRDATGHVTVLKTNSYDEGALFGPSCVGGGGFACSGGRLTTSRDYDDFGAPTLTQTFAYAGLNGRLATVSPVFATNVLPGSLSVAYNNFGLESNTVYPEGLQGKGGAFALQYTYANGYLLGTLDGSTGVSYGSAKYNAAGGIQTVTTSGNVSTNVIPDGRNRPAKITIGAGTYDPATDSYAQGTFYRSGAYGYDGAGNITAIGQSTYRYDAASRLVQAVEQVFNDTVQRQHVFGYDDYGNMTTDDYSEGGVSRLGDRFNVTEQTTKVNLNQILSHEITTFDPVTHNPTITTNNFTYDPRGNLIVADTQESNYDTRNRISGVRLKAGHLDVARYAYDGSAARVWKEDARRGVRTFFVRDPQGRLLSEFRMTRIGAVIPEWTKHYVYMGDRLIAMRENQVPGPVGGLTATTATGNITLSWLPNPAVENVSSYRLYRTDYPIAPTPIWVGLTITQPTYSDNTVADGHWYAYKITALGGGAEGYASDPLVVLAASVTAPPAPTGLNFLAGDRRVDLTWVANAPGDSVIGYNVYRDGATTPLNVALLAIPAFADIDLANGSYNYAVTAVNAWKKESPKSLTVTAAPRDFTRTAPPQNVYATPDCAAATPTINVQWQAPVSGSDVSKYILYRDPPFVPNCTSNCGKDVGLVTKYADTGLTSGTSFRYWVVAMDTATIPNSSASSLATVATPRNVSGTISVPAQAAVTADDGKVTLRVVYPQNRPYPVMRIYRKQNVQTTCDGYVLIATVDTSSGTYSSTYSMYYQDYVDRTAPNGSAYDYAVTNLNANGLESGYSITALAIPTASPVAYNECIEDLHSTSYANYQDGSLKNDSVASSTLKRLKVRVQPPNAKPYNRLTATTVGGTQSFLQGYHLYDFHTPTNPAGHDSGSLTPVAIDLMKKQCGIDTARNCSLAAPCPTGLICDATVSRCMIATGVGCIQNSNCSAGQICAGIPYPHCSQNILNACNGPGTCAGVCTSEPVTYGVCGNETTRQCLFDTDCVNTPPGNVCVFPNLYDVYLNAYADAGFDLPTWRYDLGEGPSIQNIGTWLYQDVTRGCLALKAVYKVYANGQWVSVESGFSDNFSLSPGAPSVRCSNFTPGTFNDRFFPGCAAASDKPPQPLVAPSVASTAPDTITASWQPAGVCTNSFTHVCSPGCTTYTPGSRTCPWPLCPADQVCVADPHYWEATSDNSDGHCVPKIPVSCNALNGCTGSGQVCETGGIDGYNLYVTSNAFIQSRAFIADHAIVPVDKNTGSLTLTGVTSTDGFQIASFAGGGRLSEMSPASPTITPMPLTSTDPIPPPKELTIDPFKDPGGLWLNWSGGGTYPNNFSKFEILRATKSGGPYTAISIPADVLTCWLTASGAGYCYDYTAPFDSDSFYVVRALTNSSASSYSQEAAGRAVPKALPATQPLRPPLNLNARAVRSDHPDDWAYIELSWCPKRVDTFDNSQSGVTGYRIYRSQQTRGPYTLITPNQDVSPLCLDGKHRCAITSSSGIFSIASPDDTSCTTGELSTCRIVDKTVLLPAGNGNYADEVQSRVYYYVVTAVQRDGSGGISSESPYSVENQGWPNYCKGSVGGSCGRYDPDNIPNLPCRLPQSVSIEDPTSESSTEAIAQIETTEQEETAPYRTIGDQPPVQNGAKQPPPPPPDNPGPSPAPPTPNAVVRFVFYHLDHLGSPIVETSSAGVLLSTHHYMPFGQEIPVVASTNTRQFTGHERDRDTGMDYMLARYYSSGLGRFMEVDVVGSRVGSPQSWNRYSYVNNNPLRLIDPNGMLAVDANLAALFPKAAAFITHLTVKSAKEYSAYKRIGGKNAGKAEVDRAFTPGSGPVFKVEKFTPSENGAGILAQYHGPLNTGVEPYVLEAFEKGVCGSATWLEAIAKHEAAHHFDSLDGKEDSDEPGDQFEREVYGRKISDDVTHSLNYERANPEDASRPKGRLSSDLSQMADDADEQKKKLEQQGKW